MSNNPVPPAGDVEVPSVRQSFDAWFTADMGLPAHTNTALIGEAAEPWRPWKACSSIYGAYVTRLTAELTLERTRADVAVADCNDAEAAERKVSQLLSDRTAERDGLLAEVASLRAERDAAVSWQETVRNGSELLRQRDALQSELTKARELLTKGSHYGPYPWNQHVMEFLARTCRAHQSALASNFTTHNVDESCGQDAEAAKGECLDCFAVREAEQNPNTECDSCGWLKP